MLRHDLRLAPLLLLLGLAAGWLSMVPPALADACAGESVEARGEPSRYLWLAKTKARANWRVKVRGTPGLGPDYANWARAQNTDERCYSGPTGNLCVFSGTPCKP